MQAPSWLLVEARKQILTPSPCALTAKNESVKHKLLEQDLAPADPHSSIIAAAESEALIPHMQQPLDVNVAQNSLKADGEAVGWVCVRLQWCCQGAESARVSGAGGGGGAGKGEVNSVVH